LSEEHLKWLPETYFPVVGQVNRFPRYKNKRSSDIFVMSFMDENKIMMSPEWGLPTPNQEAAYKSLSKYAKDVLPISEEQVKGLNLAWEWTAQHFGPYMGGARVRTVQEVLPELDKDTSSGYPFNAFFPKKKDLFEGWPELSGWLEKDWDELLKDNYSFMFTNSLKEEIRPEVKTQQNKIRTFTAGAIDGTVHGNRLFADMNERMNASYLRSSSGVGMSPLKGNWDRLYRKLNMFRKGYALDESEYDSSLRCFLMWGCAKLRWEMLRDEDKTPENLKRIKNYYRNLVNSLVITPEGVIVLKLGGNPSGSVNTINDNTLILYTLLAYAWIMNCSDEPDYFEFEANTSKILVGDDNTWTVSDWAHTFFNARTVIATWNQLGVTTTTDDLEPREAKELDFLSAKTIFYLGRAIPVYDRSKLMTSLLFAETKKQSPAFTLLRAAALLSVGWSDAQFRKFCREFICWLIENFDEVCANDLDWIQAKCGILSDERLAKLFLGDEILLQQSCFYTCMKCYDQGLILCHCNDCFQEIKERLCKPDKRMNQPGPSKKSSNRKKRGGKKGGNKPQVTRKQKTVVVVEKKKRNRPARRRGGFGSINNGPGPFGGQLLGKGTTRNRTTNRQSMILEEDEYIDEVVGGPVAANFNTVSIPVNIGQAGTFPWASRVVGTNFEKYQFEYLEFYYKREVSEFATNGTTGKIMLSFDTDASDGLPLSKVQVEDTDPHADGMPCENIRLVVPPRMLRRMTDGYFIRPAGLPGGADIKTYDVGQLFVSTQGLASANAAIGELHVRYRCRVFIPILENQQQAPTNNAITQLVSDAGEVIGASGVAQTLLMAQTHPTAGYTNGLNFTNNNGSITPPAGNYLVTLQISSTNTGNGTAFEADIFRNGAPINNSLSPALFTLPSAAYASWDCVYTSYVSTNGGDIFYASAKNTFSTGTSTVFALMTWLAV